MSSHIGPSIKSLAKPFVELSSEQETLLYQFIDLIIKFNSSKRLTSLSKPDQWISNHVIDCVAAYSILTTRLTFSRVFDCGSGNGLPGVIFAILSNKINLSLYDTDNKKCQFLKTVVFRLGLTNVSVENSSILEIDDVPRGTLFVYRAFSPIDIMYKSIEFYKDKKHCFFAADHFKPATQFQKEHAYSLPNGTVRKIIII